MFAKDKIQALLLNPDFDPNFCYNNNILTYKGRMYIGTGGKIRSKVIQNIHGSHLGGHSGIHNSIHRAKRYFYWPGMNQEIRTEVLQCEVCQKCKGEHVSYPGLLQPLPVPLHSWSHISLDFIEGLPNSKGKDTKLVIVDRFTKYGHILALSHPFTAVTVAKIFLDSIFKLHGLPRSITSDRDKVFTS